MFVEKQTAKKPGRPVFNEMLARIEKGEADGILAWHPDRLARNSLDGGRIIYLLDIGALKDVKFCTFWFENTPQGKLMLAFAFGMSKYYVDQLGEGIRRGHERKIKSGIWPQFAPLPVHVATDLTPAQVRAYRIADNQTATIAEWNIDLLGLELAGLREMEFDLNLLGFDQQELLQYMSGEVKDGLTDPDDVPLPPNAAVTHPGDIWILGDHRLHCGDSSKPEDLDRLLDGATIQLVHMDPPYNVAVEPRSNNAIAAGNSSFPSGQKMHVSDFDLARFPGKSKPTTKKLRAKDRPLANDAVTDEQFAVLLRAWFANASRVLDPGRAFYVWGGYANVKNYPAALAESELYFSQAIIWVKQHPVLGRKDFMSDHEWSFYGWKEGAAHKFFGANNIRDVWEVKKVNPQSMVHLTEKPVELAVRAMQYSSLAGENVLDLFGGSGSTLIGAEQTRRNAYLMELDALYCDVIVQRWESFTGRKAKRAAAVVTDTPEKTPASTAGVVRAKEGT